MFKKIMFYIISLILGLMILMTSYYGFYINHNQEMIQTALKSDNPDDIARLFLPFYNKNQVDVAKTDKYDLYAYESVTGEKAKLVVDGKERDGHRYQESITFLMNDISFDLDGKKVSETTTHNYTSLVLYNDDKTPYRYYFNWPTDGTSGQEGVERLYAHAAKTLKFVEIDLSTKIIDEQLGGAIDKIEVVDAKDNVIDTIVLESEIRTDTKFFDDVKPLPKKYDECIQFSNRTEDFNNFFTDFLNDYKKNENYDVIMSNKERKPMKIYLYTGFVMLGYLSLIIVLGYFFLRKKDKTLKPYQVDAARAARKANSNVLNADVKEVKKEVKQTKEVVADKPSDVKAIDTAANNTVDENTTDTSENKDEDTLNK